MPKLKDKYEELGGEFMPSEVIEEEADLEGVNLKEAEESHFEESDVI